jgi:AraC family transcriptional regulator
MNPAQKALWFIESHLAGELTLDEIAGIGGVSRFHMCGRSPPRRGCR